MKKNYQTILKTFIASLCLFSMSLNAQLFSTVGAGTTGNANTGYPSPYGNWYYGAKHQLFVTAAELTAAGIAGGAQIKSVGFNIYNLNGANPHQGWVMNVYATTSTDPLVSGWNTAGLVASSSAAAVTGTIGWNQTTFNTPFIWNGSDNLVIETCFNNTSFTYNYSTYWMSNLTGTSIKSRWRNADNATNCTDPPVSTSANTRPDMRFEWISPTPCNGAPPANSVTGPTSAICPNASAYLAMAMGYTLGGINYAWYSSTTSSVGPWTSVTGTNPGVSVPNQTATSFFMAVATCSSGGSTSLTAFQVTVQAVTTNTPPYFESFEGINLDNRLPNCSWSASNLGAGLQCQTYMTSNTNNRVPRTGNKFASFYYNPIGTNYFYTNGIYMTAGITYSAALWYTSEYVGYTNWTDLSIMYGPTQTPTGLIPIASTGGPAVSNVYKLLSNTFTVAATGLYYVAIKATTNSNSGAQYLSWDDLSITIPCQPGSPNNPTLALAPTSATICAGDTYNMSVTGADTYTWNTGDMTNTLSNELYYTTPFQVIGTNALTGCTATLNQVITVNPSPSVLVFANKQTICAGESVFLTAMGASNYTWSSSPSSNNVITASPLTTTTYSVWGANAYGCSKMATQVINVNALPTVSASSSAPNQMCVGERQTLSATGAAAFTWVSNTSNIVQSGSNISINPTSTSVYTVTGTDINGCSNVATITQVVDPCTGISKNLASGSSLNVYPNPGSGEYTVEIQAALKSAHIEVVDITGKVILNSNVTENKTTVNLTQYANGVYFLKLQSEDSVDIIKLIKQ